MEEEFILSASKNNKIIIFGQEGSWKSTILNSLSNTSNLFQVNDISNYAEINANKNFLKRKVLIDESQYELHDTIGYNPSYKIDNLEKKLEKFKKLITLQKFSLVLITFPMTASMNFDYAPLQLFLKTFSFTNNKSVFLVLTQGEKIEDEVARDECYDTFKEEIRTKNLRENLPIPFKNIIIFESNKLEEFRKEILLKAEDLNLKPTEIEIKCDTHKKNLVDNEIDPEIKALEKLYVSKEDEEEKPGDNGINFLELIKNFIDQWSFLNSPNMII